MSDKRTWFTCGPYASAGYSPRVAILGDLDCRIDAAWNPTAVEAAHLFLKSESIWGGCDKKCDSPTGEWWLYEIPEERYFHIMDFLLRNLGEPTTSREARVYTIMSVKRGIV